MWMRKGEVFMKLRGTFTIREVAGEIIAIPVGNTALELNGMIILNPVSRLIWEKLEKGSDVEQILDAMTEAFEVDRQVAAQDLQEILDELSGQGMLED